MIPAPMIQKAGLGKYALMDKWAHTRKKTANKHIFQTDVEYLFCIRNVLRICRREFISNARKTFRKELDVISFTGPSR